MVSPKAARSRWLAALVIATGTAAYAQTQAPSGATPTWVPSPGKKLALNFASSPNGGIPAGTFNNFGFSIDATRPVLDIAVRQDQPGRTVVASYDYADCSVGQESLLERPVRDLARGTPVWVDYVEIELIPHTQKDLKWSGGVCYGFRKDGDWHWNLSSTPLVKEEDRITARLWVKQGDVDALKLVFDYSVRVQSVRRVTVTTQPVESKAVK